MKKPVFNLKATMCTSVVRTPSLVDEFYTEVVDVRHDVEVLAFSDPIYMLFNQQRLSHLGAENVQLWLDSLNAAGHSEIAKLRSQCSVSDLVSMIKSRHLQSPSEILAWSKYMDANMDEFHAEVQRIHEDIVAQQQGDATGTNSQTS